MIITDPHTLTGAYALGALDEEERAAVDGHLEGCPSCAREVEELTETVTRLGLAVSIRPTAALREEVLRRIPTVRQLPPATSPSSRPGGGTGRRAGDGAEGRFRRASRWALAACLAGVVALGGVSVLQYERAEDARQEARRARSANSEVAAVLAAPDARVSTTALGGGAVGTVVVSAARDRAVFAASGLPAPPEGKVYQLWFDDGGAMRSAGLVAGDARSEATLMEGPVGGATGMGVTVEPAGGSPRPTSAPLALMPFPA
ncbi:anti-sigma factor domain-containing protein [Streptomyces sp. NPDC003035]|uniref:anti-sigma factor n=1 Tax=Streptomyces sp. NPDC003035 TaxID=3364676 RepID=UPI0036D05433